jgi:hypothetical protein
MHGRSTADSTLPHAGACSVPRRGARFWHQESTLNRETTRRERSKCGAARCGGARNANGLAFEEAEDRRDAQGRSDSH